MKKKTPLFIFAATLTVVTGLLFAYYLFLQFYEGQIYPGVTIAGRPMAGQTAAEANKQLTTLFQERINKPLTIGSPDQQFTIHLTMSSPEGNFNQTVEKAYIYGRSGNYLQDFWDQLRALTYHQDYTPEVLQKRPTFLASQITSINQTVKTDPTEATVKLGDPIAVTPSHTGKGVDMALLMQQINNYLSLKADAPTDIPMTITYPKLDTATAEQAKALLARVKDKPLQLQFNDQKWTVDQAALYKLLDLQGSQNQLATITINQQQIVLKKLILNGQTLTSSQLLINQEKLNNYLDDIAEKIDRPAQEGRFTFEEGRVTEFQASQEGQILDRQRTYAMLMQALNDPSQTDIALPVTIDKPKVTTASVNNLGIEEIIGQGVSNFAGSIPGRVINVRKTAALMNGILIPPGETFSYVKAMGEIDGAHGWAQAYVIKEGRTVLDDGGGVCQGSTTIFRAALNAGLPIVTRTAHAYRVHYYEEGGSPPGIDATVFSPSVDFRFRNDTGSYVLVQTKIEGTVLTVNLYGKSDGRVATLTKPIIHSQTPPPADLRQDDPTLPKGQVKQVDFSAWGANISFKRTVTRGDEVLIDETFRSNYRPWQAIYLVGTKEG